MSHKVEANDTEGYSPSRRQGDRHRDLRPGWILVILILVGFLIGLIGDSVSACHSGPPASGCAKLTELLAQNNNLILWGNTDWGLFTSIFVTDSIPDAVFNAFAVIILDRFIEGSFNHTRYFAVFFSSALLGNILSLLNGPNYASAGASGGIFGLFAATFAFTWAHDKKIDTSTLGLFLVIFVTSTFLFPGVDFLAHIGGSIGGFVAGPLLYEILKGRISRFEPVSKSSSVAKILAASLIAALTLGSVVQFVLFLRT